MRPLEFRDAFVERAGLGGAGGHERARLLEETHGVIRALAAQRDFRETDVRRIEFRFESPERLTIALRGVEAV